MSSELILVTGAGGFIGMHVIDKFIKEGYRVRGTVRNLNDSGKIAPLRKIASEDKLELVEIDLLDDAAKWQAVLKGVSIVIHVASPFPIAQPTDESVLIKPAVEGTLKVLNAAFEEKVKRVVLTSSLITVIGYTHEERSYSEADWADLETCQPYGKSKTLAEKAAWDFVDTKKKANEQCFELVVINPSFVLGPTLHTDAANLGTSEKFMVGFLSGKYEKIPNLWHCMCDVRDVALAHFKGAFSPDAVGHRHIIVTVGEKIAFQLVSLLLRDDFTAKGYKVPTDASEVVPPVTIKVDNTRMKNVLGITPIPLRQTVIDMANSVIDAGFVQKL